jgi:hypothetical protein
MNTDYFSSTKRLFLLVGFFAVTTLACAAETPVEIVLRLDAARLKALGAGRRRGAGEDSFRRRAVYPFGRPDRSEGGLH